MLRRTGTRRIIFTVLGMFFFFFGGGGFCLFLLGGAAKNIVFCYHTKSRGEVWDLGTEVGTNMNSQSGHVLTWAMVCRRHFLADMAKQSSNGVRRFQLTQNELQGCRFLPSCPFKRLIISRVPLVDWQGKANKKSEPTCARVKRPLYFLRQAQSSTPHISPLQGFIS